MGESAQTKRNKSSFIIKIYVIIIIKLCSFGCTSNDWALSVIEQSEMVTAPTANTNQPIPFKEYHSFHRGADIRRILWSQLVHYGTK